MGNTSIIEIDHDKLIDIEHNPKIFIREILEQCRSFSYNGRHITGGRVITGFHRSDTPEDKLWEKFKNDLHKLQGKE